MYEELGKRLRKRAVNLKEKFTKNAELLAELTEAADAIEELSRQRDRAYSRLCEWCHVCPLDKRNPEGCEFAALIAEAAKDTNVPTYDLLYEEGGLG